MSSTTFTQRTNAMNSFLQRHADSVTGTLSGFDRLLFRGTLLSISYVEGMDKFLGGRGVLYKDYGRFAEGLSDRLKRHAQELAEEQGRPFQYLGSASVRKEQVARRIMERDGVKEGLICVLSCVEPCRSISIRSNRVSNG